MTLAVTLLTLLAVILLMQISMHLGKRSAQPRVEHGDRTPRRDETPWDERSPASRWLATFRARLARRAALPLLPEGHRPPAGLGPISPSERFLVAETARGLRELELFLHDPA